MKRRSSILTFVAVLTVLTSSVIATIYAKDKDKAAPMDAVVQFAHLVSPAPAACSLAGTLTHFLNPDDVTIGKGGTVTFVINNGGHGLAIYPVDKKTTRDGIASQLCQGPAGAAESDREARFAVCAGPQANLNYDIFDAKGDLIIRTGTNVNNSNPPSMTRPTGCSEHLDAWLPAGPARVNRCVTRRRSGPIRQADSSPETSSPFRRRRRPRPSPRPSATGSCIDSTRPGVTW